MSFKIATAYVAVEADDAGLRTSITEKVKAAADGVAGNVRLDVDADGLAEKVKAEAEAADAETHVKVKVDDTGASDLRQSIERLGEDVAADADAAGSRVGNALGNGLFRDAKGYIRNASGQFATDAEKMAAGFDTAGNASQRAGSKAGGAGANFHLAAVGVGALAAAGASVIPVLLAIPAAAAAAASGVAVLGAAFGGVTKALHDYGAMDNAVGGGGGGGGNTAATAYSNAVAVRNAEQAITDARTQAARSAQADAEQVANAAQGVKDAERSAASAAQQSADQIVSAKQQIANAAYAQTQAEQSYTNAVYNEQQADEALVNARKAAANQLVDSQNSAADAHLATEQAALNANTAQEALTASQGNSLLTGDQRAQIDLAAQQAAQQLADAKQKEKEATEAANAATAAGVDNAPTVLSAEHAAEQAAQATASAQHGIQVAAQQAADAQTGLARAQQAAANQQISSAEQVGKAQQGLADAERQQAQDRADSAEQIAKAEQNLTDTIKEQQLQSVAGSAAGSAAVNQYAQDLKNLSPAGRALVAQVISMKGELHDLALEAQTATLPGFTQMLKDSEHLLPVVRDGIKNIGGAFSNTAAAAGKLFANPEFDAAALHFEQIVTGGFTEVMSGLPPLMDAVVKSGSQAGPVVDALAVGIHNIEATGLPAFLDGLSTGMGGASQATGALLGGVDNLLGPIGQLAGAVANAAGPAVADLVPHLVDFATNVEQDLLPILPQLSTDLLDVSQVLDALLQIATPVAGMLANDLGAGLRIIDPLLQDTAHFLQDNQKWLVPVAEGILGVVAAVKTWNALQSISSTMIDKATTGLQKLGIAAKDSATAEAAASTTAGEAGLAGSLGTVLPIVGAVTLGIVALGTKLNDVIYGSKTAAITVDQFTEALLQSETPTGNAVAKLDSYSQLSQYIGSNAPEVTDALAQTGLGMIKMANATGVTTTDLKNYDGALAAMVSDGNADRARTIVQQLATATDAHGQKIVDVNRDLPTYAQALLHAAADSDSSARATQHNADATANLDGATKSATDRLQAMSQSLSQSQAITQFHTQLLGLKDALDQNGTSLDSNSSKGLANQQQFQNLAQQIESYGQQLHDSGVSESAATGRMQDMVTQLEDQAAKFGYNKTQVDNYIKSIGLVPSSVDTKLMTEIDISVNQQLLEAAAKDVGHVVGHYLVPGNAVGGLITGPGTGTSDSVLRRLSNGEYVMTADTVAKLGVPYLDALNYGNGASAAPAAAPISQVGGTTPQASAPVINLNYYGTQQPTVEQQQNMMNALALAVRG